MATHAEPAITTTYRLPVDLYEWLVREASRRGITRLALVIELLRHAQIQELTK